jgi:DNA-binding NtrC family response regulator
MLQLLENVIRQCFPDDIHIKTANDPSEARLRLETEIIDLLITDLEMPGINGLELLRCAKRSNVWTQVLLVTGHSNIRALMDAMDMGASDYLLKPLDLDELSEAITSILHRSRRWKNALVGTLSSQ